MVDVALLVLVVDAVELLGLADGAERADGQHLGLAAGKHAGAVDAGQQADLGGQRADLVHLAAVDALLLVEQPAADDEFLELVERLVDLGGVGLLLVVELRVDALLDGGKALVAHALVVGVERGAHVLDGELLDRLEEVGGDLDRLEGELRLADLGLDLLDLADHLLDLGVALDDRVEHDVVGDLVGARLDHADDVLVRRDGQVQVALRALLGGRADDDLAVDKPDVDTGDRSVPGDIGDGQRERNAAHAGDLGRAVGVDRHDGHDDRAVVAHVLGEERADGAVDEAGVEDRLVGGARLALDEGAGDLADRIELLLEVDRQREKVDALAGLLGGGDVAEHDRLAPAHEDRRVGQAAHLARFKGHFLAAVFDFVYLVVFKHCSSSVIKIFYLTELRTF